MNIKKIGTEFKKTPAEWIFCGFVGALLLVQLINKSPLPEPTEPTVLLDYSFVGHAALGPDLRARVSNELIVRSLKCRDGNLQFGVASAQGEYIGMIKNSPLCEGDYFSNEQLVANWASSPS